MIYEILTSSDLQSCFYNNYNVSTIMLNGALIWTNTVSATGRWVAVNFADITSNDVVIITAKVDDSVYALKYGGDSTAPTAVIINSAVDGQYLTGTVPFDYFGYDCLLKPTMSNSLCSFRQYAVTNFLKCNNTNNGIRWSDNEADAALWYVDPDNSPSGTGIYLKE